MTKQHDIVCCELVYQLCNMVDVDEDEWADLLRFNVLDVIRLSEWWKLPERGQFAVAIVIVGSKSLSHYSTAFSILWYSQYAISCYDKIFFHSATQLYSNWAFVGGCYWVVQLELMRHAALNIICLQTVGPVHHRVDTRELIEQIEHILPYNLPEAIINKKLRSKLAMLRADLLWLVDKMSESSHPHEVFVDYYSQFELSKFVPWFIKWAMGVLVTSEEWFEPIDVRAILGGSPTQLHSDSNKENENELKSVNCTHQERGRIDANGFPLEELNIDGCNAEIIEGMSGEERLLCSPDASSLTYTEASGCTSEKLLVSSECEDYLSINVRTVTPDQRPFSLASSFPHIHLPPIITDPYELGQFRLQHRRQICNDAILHAVETCDFENTDVFLPNMSQEASAQVGSEMSFADMKVEINEESIQEKSVMMRLLNSVWESFAPDSQGSVSTKTRIVHREHELEIHADSQMFSHAGTSSDSLVNSGSQEDSSRSRVGEKRNCGFTHHTCEQKRRIVEFADWSL